MERSSLEYPSSMRDLDPPHLAMSYTALLILAVLEDDFTRLDRQAMLECVARCQTADGR